MPNWIHNELQVFGSLKELQDFREKLIADTQDGELLPGKPLLVRTETVHLLDECQESEPWKEVTEPHRKSRDYRYDNETERSSYRYSLGFSTPGVPGVEELFMLKGAHEQKLRMRLFSGDTMLTAQLWMILEDDVIRERECSTREDVLEVVSQEERAAYLKTLEDWDRYRQQNAQEGSQDFQEAFFKVSGGNRHGNWIPEDMRYENVAPRGDGSLLEIREAWIEEQMPF